MNLKLTVHFQTRMAERGIELDYVKKAIREPDSTESVFDGKTKVEKAINGKIIIVIYSKESFRDKKDQYLLVTAYYRGEE